MTLKVALTGSHGTGKTYIIEKLTDRLEEDGYVVRQIVSPTRYVKSLGFNNNKSLDFKTEWMCVALRIQRQRSAIKELADIEEMGKKTVLLSDRCLLDELSYTLEAVERFGSQELLGFYHMAKKFIEEDVVDFWDYLFYKPIHPDFLPVADSARLDDVEYQKSVDSAMLFHFNEFYKYRDNGFKAQEDRDQAVQEIYSLMLEKKGRLTVDH